MNQERIPIKLDDGRFFECYTLPQILDGKSIGRVWSFRDITHRIALEEKLQFQATHDALTLLPNRTLLMDRIDHEISRAKGIKTCLPSCLSILIDSN